MMSFAPYKPAPPFRTFSLTETVKLLACSRLATSDTINPTDAGYDELNQAHGDYMCMLHALILSGHVKAYVKADSEDFFATVPREYWDTNAGAVEGGFSDSLFCWASSSAPWKYHNLPIFLFEHDLPALMAQARQSGVIRGAVDHWFNEAALSFEKDFDRRCAEFSSNRLGSGYFIRRLAEAAQKRCMEVAARINALPYLERRQIDASSDLAAAYKYCFQMIRKAPGTHTNGEINADARNEMEDHWVAGVKRLKDEVSTWRLSVPPGIETAAAKFEQQAPALGDANSNSEINKKRATDITVAKLWVKATELHGPNIPEKTFADYLSENLPHNHVTRTQIRHHTSGRGLVGKPSKNK